MIRFRYLLPISLLLFWLCAVAAFAQNPSFTLLNVDLNDYPRLRARFFLSDPDGKPIRDLFPGDVLLRDNGVEYSPFSVTCPDPAPPERISSVLALDVSGSMLNWGNIGIARAAATAWIDLLPLGYSECAVTSFDHEGYLNRDFTINRQALVDAIAGVRPETGGTDYNAGLIADPVGAITLAGTGAHKRIVVFLTDGEGGGNEQSLIKAARDNGVTVYAVVLRMRAPELLKHLAEQSGGLWFEGVESREEAEAIYRAILRDAQGEEPCELLWDAVPDCEKTHHLEIEIPFYNVLWKGEYILPDTAFPALSFAPFGVSFGYVPSGSTRDTVITVTAKNRPVTVFSLESESPFFSVVSGADDLPFLLDPGESRELTVRFAPADSAFRYGRIRLGSDACSGDILPCTGGLAGVRADETALRLTAPNGGEVFPVGSDVLIEWEGMLPHDTAVLEYSLDGGASWKIITEEATGLQYLWSAPPTPSDRCLMRVRQRTAAGESGVMSIRAPERLSAGDFSPDGRFVAIGERNISVRDSYTGDLLSQVVSGGPPILSLLFSPDNANLLVVGTGGAGLYDWQTGMSIRSYGTSIPVACDFNPDGSRIAAHTQQSDVVIYDAQTSQEISHFIGHTFRGYAVAYSPDGSRIVSGGTDNLAIIWDAVGGAILHRLPHNHWVNTAFFSPDGSRVVTTCRDSTVRVWDVLTGALLLTIPETAIPSCAKYSPDGTVLLVSRFDPVVEIRDAQTGLLLRELIGHRRSVQFADWNNDGSRILTVSWDSTARIWDPSRVPNRSDLSDAYWSIVEPQLALRDVDMGRAAVGTARDSVVVDWLCNTGTFPMRIDSITFADGREFSLVSGRPPFVLQPGDCVPVEFRFSPERVSSAADSIIVHAGSFTTVARIYGLGMLDPLDLVVGAIDFGQVRVGGKKDTLVSVVLQNRGFVPLAIARTDMIGPDMEQFAILSGGGAFSLMPGEMRMMEFRFAPIRKGKTSGKVLIEYGTITNSILGLPPAHVLLYGEGICPEDVPEHTLALPETIEAAPGDRVGIPVIVDGPVDPGASGTRRYTLLLRYNKSLLAPLDSAALDISTEDERLLLYEGEWSGESDTLRVLPFLAALGNAESTPVVIESFAWEDGCDGGLTIRNGRFRLNGLCPEGGTRLFIAGDSLFLKPLAPNPARDRARIEYGVIEAGRTDLYLLDGVGRKVAVLVSAPLAPGHYLLEANTSGLSSGLYYLVLQTPTRMITESLLIGR